MKDKTRVSDDAKEGSRKSEKKSRVQNGQAEKAADDDVNINVVNVQNKRPKKSKRQAACVAEEADVSGAHDSPAKKRKVDCKDESVESAELGIKSYSSTSEEKKKKKKKRMADPENSTSSLVDTNSNGCSEVMHCASETLDKLNSQQIASECAVEHYKQQAASEAADGSFEKYRISAKLCERLKEKGINSLFPVQTMSYNFIYDNYDVIVQARTGSGKTLSFAIPLVEKLQQKNIPQKPRRSPQVLVMTPTRELAKQVSDTFEMICDPLTVLCVYGGTPIIPQANALRAGIDILIGTPGRILDFIRRGSLDLSQLNHVVLDEVDRMLDMGFAEDVDSILKERYSEDAVDKNPQTLLFSATMPDWVHQTARKYLRSDRKHLDLVGDDRVKTSKTVQHLAICCGYFDRASTIGAVLQVYSGSQGRAMIFCETKREADELALNPDIRQETHVIHGDIPQAKREMVLTGFREGRYKCLIATDVAARGLDIPEVDLVIQCCPPKDVDSYIHRSGRTGRAGRDGTCVLFYKPKEESEIGYVERKAGITFKRIGPPTAGDIIKACTEDAVRTLEAVPQTTLKHFKDVAEKLVVEKDVVSIVSAALAIISGNADMKPRSLLSSREGFTTFLFRTTVKMDRLGYVWRGLERCVSAELKEKISWMTFCADRQGCVFDVPTELADTLLEQWKDGRNDTLTVASELPQLLKPEKPTTFDFNNGRSSFGAGRGGGRGGYGAGRGRGGNSFGNDRRRESWGSGRGRGTGRGGRGSGWSRDSNRNGYAQRNGGSSDGYAKNSNRSTFEQ